MKTISISIFINFILLSVICIESASSASFPNPPQRPPSNASPEEHALFWKLLHNYYAIIARPRFGKRFDSIQTNENSELFNTITDQNFIPSYSSEYHMNENIPKGKEERIDFDNLYTLEYPDRKRRRRR